MEGAWDISLWISLGGTLALGKGSIALDHGGSLWIALVHGSSL